MIRDDLDHVNSLGGVCSVTLTLATSRKKDTHCARSVNRQKTRKCRQIYDFTVNHGRRCRSQKGDLLTVCPTTAQFTIGSFRWTIVHRCTDVYAMFLRFHIGQLGICSGNAFAIAIAIAIAFHCGRWDLGSFPFSPKSSGISVPSPLKLSPLFVGCLFWEKRTLAKYVRAKNVNRTNCYCLK